MLNERQEGAKLLVRRAALVGGLAALSGVGASVLTALDVIRVEWDYKRLLCAIAAILCCGYLLVCGLAWRLRRGAIRALGAGYLLVGFVLGFHGALVVALGFPAAGHERQLAATAIVALGSIGTGIAVHRQIAILKDAS